jgi:hypothetical protein
MKKLLIYGFVLMLCLTAGCKKDNKQKVYLLQQQIIINTADGTPIDTTTFSYDDKNRMTTIVDGSHPHRSTFTIEYDSQDRVAVGKKFGDKGALVIQYDFFYLPDSVGYNFHGPIGLSDTSVFTFNDKKQITRIQTRHAGYIIYTYDSRGNVATSDNFRSDGTNDLADHFTYVCDTQRNPFSQTAPNNYFLMYIAFTDASTLINNVEHKNADVYTFTYNADGFPVSANAKVTGRLPATLYYKYIEK